MVVRPHPTRGPPTYSLSPRHAETHVEPWAGSTLVFSTPVDAPRRPWKCLERPPEPEVAGSNPAGDIYHLTLVLRRRHGAHVKCDRLTATIEIRTGLLLLRRGSDWRSWPVEPDVVAGDEPDSRNHSNALCEYRVEGRVVRTVG